MNLEIWQIVAGFLISGGLSSLFTMRIGVKTAKADLMKSMQDIYGKLIEDLRREIETIRELGCIYTKCDKRLGL